MLPQCANPSCCTPLRYLRDGRLFQFEVRAASLTNPAEENQQLIDALFAELDQGELDGFTYKVFRLEDGVSFIHVAIEHDVEDPDSLQAVPAFQAFVAGIAERCDVPPVATGATVVGGYR